MKFKQNTFILMLIMAFLVAACGGAPTAETMMEEPDQPPATEEAMMSEGTHTSGEAMISNETPKAESMMESPAWFSIAMTDVRTGQSFSIQRTTADPSAVVVSSVRERIRLRAVVWANCIAVFGSPGGEHLRAFAHAGRRPG